MYPSSAIVSKWLTTSHVVGTAESRGDAKKSGPTHDAYGCSMRRKLTSTRHPRSFGLHA